MEKLLLSSILATLFAFGVGVSVPTSNHRGDELRLNGFTKIGEKYYMIADDLKFTWFGAAHFCHHMDAKLASIESESEWQALSTHLVSKGYNDKEFFWLSGNNFDNLKDFHFLSSGQPMKYSKWSHGYPDSKNSIESCTHLWPINKEYTMNHASCYNAYHLICEAVNPKTIAVTI